MITNVLAATRKIHGKKRESKKKKKKENLMIGIVP
jgi:hypothetical protein